MSEDWTTDLRRDCKAAADFLDSNSGNNKLVFEKQTSEAKNRNEKRLSVVANKHQHQTKRQKAQILFDKRPITQHKLPQ